MPSQTQAREYSSQSGEEVIEERSPSTNTAQKTGNAALQEASGEKKDVLDEIDDMLKAAVEDREKTERAIEQASIDDALEATTSEEAAQIVAGFIQTGGQ